jgi:hypothetical protein
VCVCVCVCVCVYVYVCVCVSEMGNHCTYSHNKKIPCSLGQLSPLAYLILRSSLSSAFSL